MSVQQERMTAAPQPPPGEGSLKRPATWPKHLSLDARLCELYLMAVVRDKKPADAEKMARFLWGEAGAKSFFEAEALSRKGDSLDDGAMPCSTPLRPWSAGQDHLHVGDGVQKSAAPVATTPGSRRRGVGGLHRSESRRTTWPLRLRSLVPYTYTCSRLARGGAAAPWKTLGRRWRAKRVPARSGRVPRDDDSRGDGASTAVSGSTASNLGPARRSSALKAPPSETGASLAEPSAAENSRAREEVAPKPFDVRQVPSHPGGGPDEKPETTTPATAPDPAPPALSTPALDLSQLHGHGGGKSDEGPSSPPRRAAAPVRESPAPLPLSRRASHGSLKSRPSEGPPACVAGKRWVTEARVVSPPAPPAVEAIVFAVLFATRVKRGEKGWV